MTFPELEKACKKRRLRKILGVFFVLIIITGGAFAVYIQVLKTDTVEKKQKPPVITSVTKEQKKPKPEIKKNKTVQEEIKKPKEELKLIIDLNISSAKKLNKTSKKPVPVKTEQKKSENLSNSKKIQTKTLPSYETCIALAKSYYEKGEYKKALNWAKNANIQNKEKPDSWILSAKALYKLGKKDEALKILKIYYNYHKDEKVKKLMGGLDEKSD